MNLILSRVYIMFYSLFKNIIMQNVSFTQDKQKTFNEKRTHSTGHRVLLTWAHPLIQSCFTGHETPAYSLAINGIATGYPIHGY
jgi:hypothetical protein